MAGPAVIERGSAERLRFLDAVRGFALILMILNHTGRWWQDGAMGWPRYNLIYASMAVGAPIFLFLVGFCLPLSFAPRRQAGGPVGVGMAAKFLQRGAKLILAGWALNLLVFRDEPFWEGGVLQTIGLGIILALPPMLVLQRRAARYGLVAFALAFYALFSVLHQDVMAWLPAHHTLGRIFFFEFAPWPWVAIVWIGLALGWVFALQDTTERRARYLTRMTAVGLGCLAVFAAWDRAHGTPIHLSLAFKRDFIVNNHWIARGVTSFLCLGAVFCLLGLAYAVEVKRLPAGWLVILGRTALMLYFLHHLIVLSLAKELLGLKLNNWWWYALANVALLVLLVGIGRLWLGIRGSVARRRLQPA
jgi:uncharacterized membrane protein